MFHTKWMHFITCKLYLIKLTKKNHLLCQAFFYSTYKLPKLQRSKGFLNSTVAKTYRMLLCVRHCSEHFALLTQLVPPTALWSRLYYPHLKNEETEALRRNLLQVIQLAVSGRALIWAQAVGFCRLCITTPLCISDHLSLR